MNNELPKDIGGYQHIEYGYPHEGDIWVCNGKPESFCTMDKDAMLYGTHTFTLDNKTYNRYRKMAQPGHHQPEVVQKLKEAGLEPTGNLSANTGEFIDQMQVAKLHETKPSNPKDLVGSDKIPLHLWPTTASALGSLALLDGMLKYGRSNFRVVGVRATIYYDALNRHMNAWIEGEDNDPDSGLPHVAHALACLAVIVDAQAAGKLEDDRLVPAKYRAFVEQMTPHVKRLKEKHKDKSPQHFTIKDNKPVASHEICG